ncbi:MAG TPA: hypothetical protein VNJ05_06050 [Sphingomicrobium sp.]|nr:hypothetical protein [Sphingomicrobium sp.]
MEDVRQLFKAIYKAVMILVTVAFAIGAVAAWWYSTPANQLMLVAGILAILTLIAGLSINKLEWQDERAGTLRSIIDDFREKSPVTLSFGQGGKMQLGIKDGANVSVQYAEPEVHRVDKTLLAEARDMHRRGEPIEAICRLIDPAFDGHDEMHQQAFRRMVQAMLE